MKTFSFAVLFAFTAGCLSAVQAGQSKQRSVKKATDRTTTRSAPQPTSKATPAAKAKRGQNRKPARAAASKAKPMTTSEAKPAKSKRAPSPAPKAKAAVSTTKAKPAPTRAAGKPRKAAQPPPSGKGWAKVVKAPTSMTTTKGVRKVPVRTYVNSVGMRFVWIPPGAFTMGSPEAEPGRHEDESPHRVEITKGFFLSTTEVTVDQWKQCLKKSGHDWGRAAILALTSPTDEHPAAHVSWEEAAAFCAWLSKADQGTYRLPTEAEWEFACRAGSDTAFAWGPEPDEKLMACDTKSASAEPVGSYPANRWGLYDMHGNVWEWCRDWYDRNAYADHAPKDPTGPESGDARVIRGGSWQDTAAYCRAANRSGRWPTERYEDLGFRVVRVAE